MRVNIYAEEMTDRIEIITKVIDGQVFTGLRLYLELPVTLPGRVAADHGGQEPTGPCTPDGHTNIRGPFIHRPGDDDSAAITFWGKRDLRAVLRHMLLVLDEHYDGRDS